MFPLSLHALKRLNITLLFGLLFRRDILGVRAAVDVATGLKLLAGFLTGVNVVHDVSPFNLSNIYFEQRT